MAKRNNFNYYIYASYPSLKITNISCQRLRPQMSKKLYKKWNGSLWFFGFLKCYFDSSSPWNRFDKLLPQHLVFQARHSRGFVIVSVLYPGSFSPAKHLCITRHQIPTLNPFLLMLFAGSAAPEKNTRRHLIYGISGAAGTSRPIW